VRRDLHNHEPDGLTVVEHASTETFGPWPLVFAAALVVILALGGGL
jgi:hypothetical protein